MGVHTCSYCSSFWRVDGLLCEACTTKLRNLIRPQLACGGYEMPTYALFDWRGEPLLNALFSAMKGGGFASTHELLATWFLMKTEVGVQDWVLVPSPPRQLGLLDHAHTFAGALSEHLKIPVVSALQRHDGVEQKSRSIKERSTLDLNLTIDKHWIKSKKTIFVDDIVTTGSTARAAYIALDRPSGFMVWTIGCRPKRLLV